MASVPQKIVLKSTTKLSLNERFSQISAPNTAAIRNKMAAERQASAQNRRLALQMARRPQVVAAMKLKKKSLRQRLGVQARLTPRQPVNVQNMQGMRGNRLGWGTARGRGRGYQVFRRGRGSSGGAMSAMRSPRGRRPFRGYRGRGQMRGQQIQRGQMRGRGRGRGQPRGSPRGFNNRGRGFRGQWRGGRGGRGAGRGAKDALSKSALDDELENYMAAKQGD